MATRVCEEHRLRGYGLAEDACIGCALDEARREEKTNMTDHQTEASLRIDLLQARSELSEARDRIAELERNALEAANHLYGMHRVHESDRTSYDAAKGFLAGADKSRSVLRREAIQRGEPAPEFALPTDAHGMPMAYEELDAALTRADARAEEAEKALRELVGQLPRCDVGDCDEVSTRAQYGYDGRITYCCQKHAAILEQLAAECGTDVNNPDTCGVCHFHFAECEAEQQFVGDECDEHDIPIGREPACVGARIRAALSGPKAG